jgi:hypothetical protein
MLKLSMLFAPIALAVAVASSTPQAIGNPNNANKPFVVPDVCASGGSSVIQNAALLLTSDSGNAGFDVFQSNPGGPATSIFSTTTSFTSSRISWTQKILQNGGNSAPILPALVDAVYSGAPGTSVSMAGRVTTNAQNDMIFVQTSPPPSGSSGQLIGLLVFYQTGNQQLVVKCKDFENSIFFNPCVPQWVDTKKVGIDASHSLTCGSPPDVY